jgi:hypothetical protein
VFGVPNALPRIVPRALIASAILLRPSASNALDGVTLIADFGLNGRRAHFFDALDKGYYRDAGLDRGSAPPLITVTADGRTPASRTTRQ